MIIVTGATGQLGAQVVARVLDRVPAASSASASATSPEPDIFSIVASASAPATSPTRPGWRADSFFRRFATAAPASAEGRR